MQEKLLGFFLTSWSRSGGHVSDRKSHCCSLNDKLHFHHQVLYHPHHHLNGQKHRDHNPHCHHHHQRQHCNVVSYGFFCSHFYPHRSQPDAFSANHDVMMIALLMTMTMMLTMMMVMVVVVVALKAAGLWCKSCLVEVLVIPIQTQPALDPA